MVVVIAHCCNSLSSVVVDCPAAAILVAKTPSREKIYINTIDTIFQTRDKYVCTCIAQVQSIASLYTDLVAVSSSGSTATTTGVSATVTGHTTATGTLATAKSTAGASQTVGSGSSSTSTGTKSSNDAVSANVKVNAAATAIEFVGIFVSVFVFA